MCALAGTKKSPAPARADAFATGELERDAQEAAERADYNYATTIIVERAGSQIMGFLRALVRNEDEAADLFSQVSEDIWRGIPTFRWDGRLRSWVYTVARNAHLRYVKQGYRRKRVPLSSDEDAPELLQQRVRTATATWLRTDTKSAVQRLRQSLSPEDGALVVLRIDRGLSWREIA